ncbi:exodeoxyribonuclease III [Runella slithyformis]|uniref:Exodeoxyribonuclease III Xth n=1 Tax=Runella slithyformis (strain ATCC 29530 / DSM 19594 / LMG 11500 / NCIMB 11436 / LSU 4) TaxID=761193 RepID=A0A7U3ZHE4_RUNSL|nr:exodeoxyribonuclease III [Runella slithyformis]AEI47250.1 exodeoxyribonuclease III Xth [Runella slithyformis DSM 19594]
MQILSYNVNGIRAAIRNGLVEWLSAKSFDILCFQEVKATPDQVDLSGLAALGYRLVGWNAAQKKGYSGVAIFSRVAVDNCTIGCGIDLYDHEGRVIRADIGDLTIVNAYFPSGTSGDERQGVKMKFLVDFHEWITQLKQTRPTLIVVGDYNIAHREIDIHDPVRLKNTTGFLPEERAWMTQWFGSGFTDAFRYVNPDLVEYSWWSYRAGARTNNKGWRIDYLSVTDNLRPHLLTCRQLPDAVHSDHCPVWLEIAADF